MPRRKPNEVYHTYLRTRRLDLGLTQRQMAEWLGVKRSSYVTYECLRCRPSGADLIKLTEVLGCLESEVDWPWGPYLRGYKSDCVKRGPDTSDPEALEELWWYQRAARCEVADPAELAGNNESLLKLQKALKQAIGTLSSRHAHVLQLRFGLDGSVPLTCTEAGKVMNVGSERIRQLEAAAIRKLLGPLCRTSRLDAAGWFEQGSGDGSCWATTREWKIFRELERAIRVHFNIAAGAVYQRGFDVYDEPLLVPGREDEWKGAQHGI